MTKLSDTVESMVDDLNTIDNLDDAAEIIKGYMTDFVGDVLDAVRRHHHVYETGDQLAEAIDEALKETGIAVDATPRSP